MSTIFVVKGIYGQWSDQIVKLIVSFRSEETAKKLVDQLTVLEDFNVIFWKKQYEEFDVPYGINHGPPTPPPSPNDLGLGLPKGFRELASVKKTTPEMKAEFKRLDKIRQENDSKYKALEQKHAEAVQQYTSQKEEARQKWFLENYNPSSELSLARKYNTWNGYYFNCGNAHYYCQKLELVDE